MKTIVFLSISLGISIWALFLMDKILYEVTGLRGWRWIEEKFFYKEKKNPEDQSQF